MNVLANRGLDPNWRPGVGGPIYISVSVPKKTATWMFGYHAGITITGMNQWKREREGKNKNLRCKHGETCALLSAFPSNGNETGG